MLVKSLAIYPGASFDAEALVSKPFVGRACGSPVFQSCEELTKDHRPRSLKPLPIHTVFNIGFRM